MSETTVLESYLLVREKTTFSSKWSRYYFILTESCLTYYKDESTNLTKGSIPVKDIASAVELNPSQSFGKQHAFKICSSKPLYLVAEDDQSRNDWISAVVALKGTENPSHGTAGCQSELSTTFHPDSSSQACSAPEIRAGNSIAKTCALPVASSEHMLQAKPKPKRNPPRRKIKQRGWRRDAKRAELAKMWERKRNAQKKEKEHRLPESTQTPHYDNEVEDERENLYDLPLRVEDWSADDVSHWLINQGFVSVVESFYMADIRGVGLLHLSLRDLEEELPISDASLRNAVFNAIQKLKATREVQSIHSEQPVLWYQPPELCPPIPRLPEQQTDIPLTESQMLQQQSIPPSQTSSLQFTAASQFGATPVGDGSSQRQYPPPQFGAPPPQFGAPPQQFAAPPSTVQFGAPAAAYFGAPPQSQQLFNVPPQPWTPQPQQFVDPPQQFIYFQQGPPPFGTPSQQFETPQSGPSQ